MTSQHSPEFFELIRGIGETKSKQEEDKIISREVSKLKGLMVQKNIKTQQMKEYVVRALYCEMLGHNADFAYFQAVNLTSSTNTIHKRVGYLAVSLCIPTTNELMLLLIAVIQKDLKSNNFLEVSAALTAASKVISPETLAALQNQVIGLKNHQYPVIRKKVAMMLHTFYTINPSCTDLLSLGKEFLIDKDPSVMGSVLNLFLVLAEDSSLRQAMKSLVFTFTEILAQILDHKLSSEFDYHRLPAPWIQIKLLKLLGQLGKDDKDTSVKMYRVIGDCIQKADSGLNIGSALVYECVNTICLIYPNPTLIETAAAAVSRFITSKLRNLQYLGIQMLKSIVKINPKYAAQHQQVVIDCLEDNDESIKRITLDLLYAMTNPNNCEVIVKRLLATAKKAVVDIHLREELVRRISFLAENFAPNSFWYIQTMNKLFELGSEYIPTTYVQNMLNIIAEGVNDGPTDEKIRIYCVETYVEMLEKSDNIPDKLLQVIAWILGEYGYMSKKQSVETLIEKLSEINERKTEDETKGWILTAIMKLSASLGAIPEQAVDVIRTFINSRDLNGQQRAYEYLVLKQDPDLMDAAFPQDGSAEDLEIDDELSFLDGFVQKAINSGAREYVNEDQRGEFEKIVSKNASALKTETYKPPETKKTNMHHSFAQGVEGNVIEQEFKQKEYAKTYAEKSEFNITNVKRVWFEDDDEPVKLNGSSPYNQTVPQHIQEVVQDSQKQYQSPMDGTEPNAKQFFGGSSEQPVEQPTWTRKEEPKKKASKENEELIGSMFGTAGEKKEPRKKVVKKKTQISQKHEWEEPVETKPETKSQGSLLDDFTGPVQTKIKSTPNPNLGDLFGQGTFVSSPKEPTVTKTTSGGSGGLMDFFKEPLKTQETRKDSILSMMDKVIEPTQGKDIVFGNSLSATTFDLCKDSFLSIVCTKKLLEESLDYELTYATTTGYSLNSVYSQFQPPEKVAIEFITKSPCTIRGNAITFSTMEPGAPVYLTIRLTITDPGFGSQFMGSITYSDPKQSRQLLSLSTKIDTTDMLRPMSMTVSEYGSLWKKWTIEKRGQFIGSPSMQDLEKSIKGRMRAHVVSSVGTEIVSAFRFISIKKTCLMHVKNSKGIFVTIKSESSQLNEKLILSAKSALEGK